jgi:hypothetical protein
MIPISTNASNTVGLVDMNNPKDNFIGEFSPLLIKQWADMVCENFVGEDVVYLAIHKHPVKSYRILSAASEHGDEIQVVVCGTDCDDIMEMK